MHGPEVILALLVLFGFALASVSLALRFKQRELRHREYMVALERGVTPPDPGGLDRIPPAPSSPRALLLRGLIWLFVGIGISASLFGIATAVHNEKPAWERVNAAVQARGMGATEDQVRQIMADREPHGMPPQLALLGLIPAGVGVAFLITYRAEKEAGAVR